MRIESSPTSINYVDIGHTVLVGNVPRVNTVVAWYRYEDIEKNGSDTRNFLWETAPGNWSLSFGLRSDTEGGRKHPQWHFEGPSGEAMSSSAATAPAVDEGRWHHVALVWNQLTGRVKYYHDGAPARQNGDVPITMPGLNTNPTGFHIGNHRDGDGTRNWDGFIDDMALFETELTAGRIADLYEGNKAVHDLSAGTARSSLRVRRGCVFRTGGGRSLLYRRGVYPGGRHVPPFVGKKTGRIRIHCPPTLFIGSRGPTRSRSVKRASPAAIDSNRPIWSNISSVAVSGAGDLSNGGVR